MDGISLGVFNEYYIESQSAQVDNYRSSQAHECNSHVWPRALMMHFGLASEMFIV